MSDNANGTTMPITFAIDFVHMTARAFVHNRTANERATDTESTIVSAKGIFDTKDATTSKMVMLYNTLAPLANRVRVSKFETKDVGSKRVFELLNYVYNAGSMVTIADEPTPLPSDPDGETQTTTKGRRVAAKMARAISAQGRGRRSEFAGCRIYPTDAHANENPRKLDSHGYRAFEVIRKNPGISYEDYAAHPDVNPAQLRWDLAHGFVRVEAAGTRAAPEEEQKAS